MRTSTPSVCSIGMTTSNGRCRHGNVVEAKAQKLPECFGVRKNRNCPRSSAGG